MGFCGRADEFQSPAQQQALDVVCKATRHHTIAQLETDRIKILQLI